MMNVGAILLLLAGCKSVIQSTASAQSSIRSWHLREEPLPLNRVDVFPVVDRPDIKIAICDYQREWSGFFGVYGLAGDAVAWQAQAAVEPMEQSIHQVRSLRLAGFTGPIFEVTGITHMGNGNLYLYELRDKKLELLLTTRMVDFNADPFQFQHGLLEVDYRDIDGDGITDLALQGVVEDRGDNGDQVIASRPCRKVFLWNVARKQFVEDLSRRQGFDGYFD
jgi:hypothetical protein